MKANLLKAINVGIVLLFSLMTTEASAGLIDRGNGMIYDTIQDITWLQDANYAKTSGYDDDGKMSWQESMDWATQLTFGGFADWRLFKASPEDRGCSIQSSNINTGFNCTKNELGHLFYNEFNLTSRQSILAATFDDEFDLFSNVQNYIYWAGNMENIPDYGFFMDLQ